MSTKPESIRNYNFSDGLLVRLCRNTVNNVTRDIVDFNDRGVTSTTVTDFENMTQEFDDIPTDEELLGDVSDKTEIKDALAENLRVSIRTVRTMASNKWGVNHAKYRTYGFNDMSTMTDNDLHRLGKRVARVGTAQMADLAGEGLTTAKITAINSINTHFDSSIDDMDDSVEIRDIATQNRSDKGNVAYSELVRFCNIGKDLFEASDEAKFNDYVIYNTPGGTPPPPVPPVVP